MGCPVCQNYLNERDHVVDAIIRDMRSTGSFQVQGVGPFWAQYSGHLCSNCQNRLTRVVSAKSKALKLLNEAVKLDPKNAAAKSNLEILKKML